jgi:hypothetical protein
VIAAEVLVHRAVFEHVVDDSKDRGRDGHDRLFGAATDFDAVELGLQKVSYQRSQLSRQSDTIRREIDPAFANDQYWLLLPFHIVWDGATVTDEGTQKLPLGEGSARRVVVKYPSKGGYQPGDTWELRWHRQANRGDSLPPPRRLQIPYRDRDLCGLYEGWTAAYRNGSSRDGGRKADSDFLFESVGSDKWVNAQTVGRVHSNG